MFGGGLSRISGYDKKKNLPLFKSLGKREGLRNDVIVSILEDNSGRLWLGNDHGLSCYNPVVS
jgi:ligand-binding sensor domain-containing protein